MYCARNNFVYIFERQFQGFHAIVGSVEYYVEKIDLTCATFVPHYTHMCTFVGTHAITFAYAFIYT